MIGYALLGAVVFRAVEGPHETFIQSQVTTARQKAVDVAWNATFRYCVVILSGYDNIRTTKVLQIPINAINLIKRNLTIE